MAATKINVKYDQLNMVAGEFQTLEATAKGIQNDLRGEMATLFSNGWLAPSADTFNKSLEDDVMPGFDRLIKALQHASESVATVASTMHQSEDAARQMLANFSA